MVNTHETVCLVIMVMTPILSAILLFNQLKFQNETQKKTRRRTQEKVLHRKQRRNKIVKPETNQNDTQNF